MPELSWTVVVLVLNFMCSGDAVSELNDSRHLPVEDYIKMRTDDMIRFWNYPSEEHKILTEDGYILTVFRIPNPGGYPVLMLHGLTVSSDCWFLRTPKEDLVFLLWKRGYDVWLWNARGSIYSREHVNISFSDEKFFDYTFHEMGVYDTPATIDYILNTTGHSSVIALGHSLGSTNVLVAASMRPEYQDKVKLNILWAQSVYMGNIKVRDWFDVFYSIYVRWLNFPHAKDFFIQGREPEIVKTAMCASGSPLKPLCVLFLREMSGPGSKQGNEDSAVKMLNRIPTGSSIWTVRQMVQNIRSGQFRPLNYGTEKNLIKYGVKKMRAYPIDKVTIPTAIYYACCNDYLSSAQDAGILKRKLPNVVRFYEIPYKKFNHGDFLWAKDSYELLYKDVMNLMDKYSGRTTENPSDAA
ncbi:hypothetical protein M8J75_011282 [Diaphorina citri]|nr:hypothetical protein M8J75_011282 [Diaphorina citri]KAI5739688.1 hypothetical protein M8J77_022209 [Diaphorina citri]